MAVVLNLGYAYPLVYVRSSQGVRKIIKNALIGTYLGRIFDLGVRKGDTSFVCTQRGKILIWGYASMKRLRTPGLDTILLCKY